jgi:hypothetical protein
VVSFTSRPLYPRGKRALYALDWRLSGPENQSGCCGEDRNLLILRGVESRASSPQVSRLDGWNIVTTSLPHPLAAFLLSGNAPKLSYKPRIQRFTLAKVNTSDLTLCWTRSIQPTSPQSFYIQDLFNSLSLMTSNPLVCPTNNFLSVYGSTVLLLDLGRFFSFLILYTVGNTPWTGDQPVERPLPTH